MPATADKLSNGQAFKPGTQEKAAVSAAEESRRYSPAMEVRDDEDVIANTFPTANPSCGGRGRMCSPDSELSDAREMDL